MVPLVSELSHKIDLIRTEVAVLRDLTLSLVEAQSRPVGDEPEQDAPEVSDLIGE
jgi:hypothetical protein